MAGCKFSFMLQPGAKAVKEGGEDLLQHLDLDYPVWIELVESEVMIAVSPKQILFVKTTEF